MDRLHYLDHLRAHMMLLGILFHCALSYSHFVPDHTWAYVQPAAHYGFDQLCALIHHFRMPAFFIVAGFFAALMQQRRALPHFLRDRGKRVLVPLLLFAWPVEWICSALWSAARQLMATGQPPPQDAFEWHHLWFLFYLVLFYGVHALLHWLRQQAGWPDMRARWHGIAPARLALPFGALMGLAVYWNGALHMAAPIGLIPVPQSLLMYLACYGFGAVLYGHPALSSRNRAGALLGDRRLVWLWLGWSLLYLASKRIVLFESQLGSDGFNPVSALSLGMARLLTALLVVALYQRFLTREHAAVRYLSNSSYWLYLMHLPVAIAVPLLLHPLDLAPTLKFVLVLTVTLATGVLSYEWLVRNSWLGELLNGRRFPRRPLASPLPASEP